ncbi:formate dehydrogenase (plasmid) [Sphingomonas paeninsulae]|uniref:Formate dehydrogenase n=1 Tax=Sphingomonas paeninsulae TaxID=2319844 RepID=A0A494THP8_SPHPE|nr:formate dehydrogenase subunit delta [Sphingomonas paeninsulae]AYJ84958.1 formate dehydrogenase [Sphingomonas paeninsulae]
MSTEDRLVYMANQIARNFAIAGEKPAALATADHIDSFWDPMMKTRIFARATRPESGLDPITVLAINYLMVRGAPSAQSQATEFGNVSQGGGSDAG